MKIFLLLVDWIWRGDPFLQTRSEDRHPTLREATLTTAYYPLKRGGAYPQFFGNMKYKKLYKYTTLPISLSPHQSLVANINVFHITFFFSHWYNTNYHALMLNLGINSIIR